jgi:uncharacterized membrane protein YeaQ/YmgE (transglycosylase-associated protein family)
MSMNNLEYWVIFGLLISIIINASDMPLRISKLLISVVLGIVGSLVGGIFAYFIFGLEVNGIAIAPVIAALTGAIGLVLLRTPLKSFYTSLRDGISQPESEIGHLV